MVTIKIFLTFIAFLLFQIPAMVLPKREAWMYEVMLVVGVALYQLYKEGR
jgi:hypothetical protein